MWTGEAQDQLDAVLKGKVELLSLSEYDRELIAGNPNSPAEVAEALSRDDSLDVATWLISHFGLSKTGVRNVLHRHPSLATEAGHHPQGPIELIAATAATSLSASTMQA